MWKKIVEIKPPSSEWVLFWDTEYCKEVPCIGFLNEYGEWHDQSNVDNCGDAIRMDNVTHWMPLPAPPTAEQVEGANLQHTTPQGQNAQSSTSPVA